MSEDRRHNNFHYVVGADLRHEQDKMTDFNERVWTDIHGQQMLALPEEVTYLRETHIAQIKTTTEMETKFRNETEKLCHNEQNAKVQGNLDRKFEELFSRSSQQGNSSATSRC
jgi:hypothetical protein